MVAGFLPAAVRSSMNARMGFGSDGKYGSPRHSQNAWKIAPSAFWARNVLAEYAPSAIACHSKSAANGPSSTGRGAIGLGSNSEGWLLNSIFAAYHERPLTCDNCNYHVY